jgi:hypothetical protein
VPTWANLNDAFTSGSVRTASDAELLEYRQVCSTIAIDNEGLNALSINRTITLNALLTQNFLHRANQATRRLTWVVIVLAVLNVVGRRRGSGAT